jgi:hypothetical protein
MKIATNPDGSPMQQGSVEWMLARSGIPTASEFDSLVTPDFKVRTGDMPKTYLAKKLAEAWQGGPLLGFNVFDMEQGQILEDEAVPWFELEHGVQIDRVGLVMTDDGRIGCSPDGLLPGGGIEIKCPKPETHVRYLLDGKLPKDYAAQVHGAMFVTGLHSWTFLSYRRHFPKFVIIVKRDEEIQKALGEALDEFLLRFDEGMKRLTEINGGPPKRRAQPPVPAMATAGLIDPDDYKM